MSLEKLLSLVAATLVAATLAIGGWVVLSDEQRLLDEAKNSEIATTGLVLSTVMDQAATLSASHAESIASDPTVIRLMREGKRDELQAYSRPQFDRLKTAAGVDIIHFHTADLVSFLRVNEPANFGQDLSKFRLMIVSANHSRRTQKGLEHGISGLSLRAIAVIESDGALVGTVEVGIELPALMELPKAATGAEFALFLDGSTVIARPGDKDVSDGRLIPVASTSRDLFSRLRDTGGVRLAREGYVEDIDLDGRALGVMGRPLLDYSGNLIGMIVVARDFSVIESYRARSTVTVWGISLCGLLIVFAVLMVVLRAAVTRPLDRLAAALDKEAEMPARLTGYPPIVDIRDKVAALKQRLHPTDQTAA